MAEKQTWTLHWMATKARDIVTLAALGFSIVVAIGMALWTSYGENIADKAGIATKQDILALTRTIEQLTASITELTGEDKILRVDLSRSYVEEPIYPDDTINIMYRARRTSKGAHCTYINGRAVFEDQSGISVSGSEIPPGVRLDSQMRKVRVSVTPNSPLEPGVVDVWLSLEYRCGAAIVPEKTPVLQFRLQDRA